MAVGHVTVDLIEEVRQPGGSAFYGALQAARLGLSALIVTRGVQDEIETLLAPYRHELALHVIPAEHTTTLATTGQGSERTQQMHAWAGPIEQLPPVHATILHIAPVAQETPPELQTTTHTVAQSFIGLTPQGLLRNWDRQGNEVTLVELDEHRLPSRYDAAVISEHERVSCAALFAALPTTGVVLAVTAGSKPTSIHTRAGQSALAPPAVSGPVDDLGAGDVFAAAFFVKLADGRTPMQAASYGNAAAALRIKGSGPAAIGDLSRIEALVGASAR